MLWESALLHGGRPLYCADHVLQLTVVKAYSSEVVQYIINHDGKKESEDTIISIHKN